MGLGISFLTENEENDKEEEEEEIIDDQKISEEVAEDVENREPRNLSLLGLECILFYIDTRKRLELFLYYPMFRTLEKSCPLILDYLEISKSKMRLDRTEFKFDKFHEKWKLVKKFDETLRYVPNGVLQFVNTVLTGRTNFRVKHCTLEIEIPFILNIDCDRVFVDSKNRNHAAYYSNVIQKVESLFITSLGSPDDLDYPWIQNVDTIIVYASQLSHFLLALPNIPAKTIFVSFDNITEQFDELILVWCECKNGIVGSQLFIVFWHHNGLRNRLDVSRLAEIGFIDEDYKLSWRLSMKNRSKARLSIRNYYQSFCKRYSICTYGIYEYLCLEVVSLQCLN